MKKSDAQMNQIVEANKRTHEEDAANKDKKSQVKPEPIYNETCHCDNLAQQVYLTENCNFGSKRRSVSYRFFYEMVCLNWITYNLFRRKMMTNLKVILKERRTRKMRKQTPTMMKIAM